MAYDDGVFLLFAFIFTVVPVMQSLHPARKLCIGMNNVKGILLHFFLNRSARASFCNAPNHFSTITDDEIS